MEREIARYFFTIEEAAEFMERSTSTARRWIDEDGKDVRFIVRDGKKLFHKGDIRAMVLSKQLKKAAKKQDKGK